MKTLNLALAAAISIGFATSAQAIPQLQLSIAGGTYNNTTETTVASSNIFTLYAYLTPGNGANVDVAALLADTYYVSMAVAPKTGPDDSDLGTFSVGSTTVNVTADMTYGVPPLEAVLADDPGDLQDHGIFDTFYYQHAFTFDSLMQTNPFDVQTSVGLTPAAGSGMYFVGFNIDVTELSKDVSIHFDLYNSALVICKEKKNDKDNGNDCDPTDIDINDFAPFSHDAQSGSGGGGGGTPPQEVPEPGPLGLLGLGLMGLWFARRKINR